MKYFDKIRKNNEFRVVYENGKSRANKYLVMYILENNMQINRIGISVSKKVGNSIVRHRLTRIIRESIRLNEEKFNLGYDIIIVARNNLKGKGYLDAQSAVLHLSKIHGILKRENDCD
ncbi:MAG: ribonuclease P protein component [Oscillospiraceae bacterium]|nr:ribonuclease P protein component [Oscillospiraceae bacterium]